MGRVGAANLRPFPRVPEIEVMWMHMGSEQVTYEQQIVQGAFVNLPFHLFENKMRWRKLQPRKVCCPYFRARRTCRGDFSLSSKSPLRM